MKISSRPRTRVSLKNRGELGLYFIGTGSAFAKTLNQNNLLIVKGDEHLLVDCGTRCSQALFDVGLNLSDIRNFVITHSHADHIGGLEEAQLFGRYVSGIKPNMIINKAYEEILWDQSLRGGSEKSEKVDLTFRDLWAINRPKKLKKFPRETWEAEVGGINIKLPRTMHFPDSAKSWKDSHWSCAVIVDDRVMFTSDTRFDPDLILSFDEMYNFDIIFHDCQLFTGGVHSSIEELATFPDHIKERIVLMHYGDNWEQFKPFAKESGFHSWAKQGHVYSFH